MRDNLVQLTEKIEGYTQNLLDLRNQVREEEEKPKKGKKK
jgi:hypothetical protein